MTLLLAPERSPVVAFAEQFLLDQLAAGSRPAADVIEVARRAGVSRRTLKRAKAKAGVRSRREGYGANGGWRWELPSKGGQPRPTRPVSVWCVHCSVFWRNVSSCEEGREALAAHLAAEHPDAPARRRAA